MLHVCSALIIWRLFDDGHSDWGEVIPHCSLIHISLIMSNVEYLSIFHVFICHLSVFFEEMSAYVFCPFFDCFPDIELMSCLSN